MLYPLSIAVVMAAPTPKESDLDALWDAGCTEAGIARFAEADPVGVREAIVAASASWRAAAVPGRATHVVGRWRDDPITYEIGIPSTEGALPALVTPAHPTWAAESRTLQAPMGRDAIRVIVHGFDVPYRRLSEDRYYAVAASSSLWQLVFRAWGRALAHAVAHYPIDPDALYCEGTSASGNACWAFAENEPDRWAGLWAVSAGWHPGAERAVFGNLAHTAAWIQHGSADPIIDGSWPRDAAAAMADVGADAHLEWVEGGGHGGHPAAVWGAGAAWLLEHRRASAPASVHLGRDWGGAETAWWLRLPGRSPATPDATWVDDGVTVTMSGAATVELVWREGKGVGRGHAGDRVAVEVNGRARIAVLEADAATPLREWCRTGDARDLPWGTARVR